VRLREERAAAAGSGTGSATVAVEG
jgi:hypothetical protein